MSWPQQWPAQTGFLILSVLLLFGRNNARIRDTWTPLLQVSFGTILTPLGLGMLVYGFGGFFQLLPGGDVSSLLLIYGFVISLLGFALSYAQLRHGSEPGFFLFIGKPIIYIRGFVIISTKLKAHLTTEGSSPKRTFPMRLHRQDAQGCLWVPAEVILNSHLMTFLGPLFGMG